MTIRFDDKVVLVTGASTGIGAAVAKGFAKSGAKVAINYGSSHAEAKEVLAEIVGQSGEAELFPADLRDTAAVKKMVEDVVAKFGRIDVLVCNAGGLVDRVGLEAMSDEFYDSVMDLNVRSVVSTCSAAIPHLSKSKGNVIITGSVATKVGGGAGASLYAASKAAAQNLIKTYGKEYAAEGIRFNSVSPGTIYTLFHEKHTSPEVLKNIAASIPMKRLGTPEDCVGAYLFLASNELAGYITGQAVEVNGGQLMP